MNIEQKNTLFVVSLVLIVLVSISTVATLLIMEHVRKSMDTDLNRAREVFVEAQKNRFDNLITVARGVRAEPSLIAATLTGDITTVRGMLDDLFPRPGADFIAVYLGTGPGGVAGAGDRPHFSSPQILNSKLLLTMVDRLINGESLVVGNALIYDAMLQIVVVPIENPLGGQVGALLVGRQFNQTDLTAMRHLVQSDIAIFNNSTVLATSIKKLVPDLVGLNNQTITKTAMEFSVDSVQYSGRVFPILSQVSSSHQAAKVLIAAPHDLYWAPYRLLGKNAMYFSAIILLVAALFGISISRRSLTRPLKILAKAARAIASGDLGQRVNIGNRDDELGQLTDSFNTMLSALNDSHAALEKSRQRFMDFADSSSDWLWETDNQGRFTYVSSSVSSTLGVPAKDFISRTPREVFADSRLGELMGLLRPADGVLKTFMDIEIWLQAPETGRHCLRMNGVPIVSHDKAFRGYRGTARDITKVKQDEKRMVLLANQDHLTGIANRRRFLQDLGHEINRLEVCEQTGVLILVDLDHLKLVNDTAGHAAGDQIIVQVAGLLKKACREEDLLARISGDEFAMAFPNMSEQYGIEKAQQLLESINALKPRLDGKAINISASAGVVTMPKHGNQPVDLMAKADAAMSSAKKSGRNKVILFDESDMSRERMDNQLTWKNRLIEALENDHLVLVYQPILAIASNEISHYEVLVRMRGDKGTYLPPDKFIPTAEQFGLIQRVDRVVLSKAIKSLASLPVEQSKISYSINLSGLSVGDPDMYRYIEDEITKNNIDPRRITFEITETAACEQLNSAIEFIEKIRRLGCKISLDDFGVGFSSFSYLKHLRADIIKIDGSFIRDIHNNNADQLFVKALVDVAQGMGMATVAEFVENQQILELVTSLGVEYAQGYHIGRPNDKLILKRNANTVEPKEASLAAV